PETLAFLDTLMSLCAKNNIYVTISPFDNYYYKEYWNNNPYNSENGGPITSPENFVTDPSAINAQKKRFDTLYNIIKDHHNFFGWEVMTEWDNDTFAAKNTGWENQRIEWLKTLCKHLRSLDRENMIYATHVMENPYDELMDFALLSDYFDFTGIHNYTKSVSRPDGSPDSTPYIRPATETRRLMKYNMGITSLDKKPVFDNEFGPIQVDEYTSSFTQFDDEEYFHNIIWAEFACGAAGMPLRWPSKVLEDRGPLLTETMWDYQENMSKFFQTTKIDFTSFAGTSWDKQITMVEPKSIPHHIFANSDGQNGLIFVLLDDRNYDLPVTVKDAVLKVKDLSADGNYRIELWNTRSMTSSITTQTISSTDHQLHISIPSFSRDIMVTFAYEQANSPPEAPKLSLSIDEQSQVTILWQPVEDAVSYTFYYAPFPSADSIGTLEFGSYVTEIPKFNATGMAFYLAIKANNSFGSSDFSNIEWFSLK
ncbi:MAG: hypothetical protein U9P10_08140, partial [Thermodesulfobacteriota bacterium]|nr:hypothetical protein [Thermodesulfobacteriota bacterium]